MNWSVSEAKAKLSEVLARARKGPQVIESRGEEVAVVISKRDFDRLQAASEKPAPSPMQQWLDWVARLKGRADLELELPPRRVEAERPSAFDVE